VNYFKRKKMDIIFHDKVTFHTVELIPWEIAKLGKDVVSKWIPEEKYWIKPGITVAHRENLNQKIYVKRILMRSFKVENGFFHDKTKQPIYKETTKVDGVECHFWEELK